MPEPGHSNEAQERAIRHMAGPLQVLAGPGSGKTYLTVHRVRHLIRDCLIPPEHILVLTFTKAAAQEMKRRFLTLTQSAYPQVGFGTFHAVYYHILQHSAATPLRLSSASEKYRFLKQALRKSGVQEDPDPLSLSGLLQVFGHAKNSGRPEQYLLDPSTAKPCINGAPYKEPLSTIYREYCRFMKQANRIDFDDILYLCNRLFSENPEMLAFWQSCYPYLLVDEFQDISPLQYEILRQLALPCNNLFVVGDDDQSIYGFRGAGPQIMRRFMEDYPQAGQVTLTANYRCRSEIVSAADTVISMNHNRFIKHTVSACEGKGHVRLHSFDSEEDEYRYLTESLKKEPADLLKDSAVIFRTNAEAASFSRQLTACHIPFVLKERTQNLFETPTALDLRAYLRFIKDPENGSRADFLRIMNRPMRYFDRGCASESRVTFTGLMKYYEKDASMRQTLQIFYRQLRLAGALRPCLAIDYIRKGMGYERYLKESLPKKAYEEALQTANAVQQSAAPFATLEEWNSFLEEYDEALEKAGSSPSTEEKRGICLLTMHASKGLEYTKVWLPDVSEGKLPVKKALTPAQVEEERRLFYVAMTRARKALEILYCEAPSRFILPLTDQLSVSSSNSSLSRYSSKASATSSYSSSSSI